jgi:outer membrane protein TolC
VAAAHAGAEAAKRDVERATSLLFPRINSFGRLDWNQPDRIGGHPAWTVGVMASWSFFGGGSELVARRAAQARAVAAATEAEAAQAKAVLELASRRNDLTVARATAEIAARAVAQATEAHRIVTRKYEGGLATVTELLESAAVETRIRVQRAAAVYQVIVAAAAWRVAAGGDGSDLTVLDQR